MRRCVKALLLGLLLVGCDQPDEIYAPLPEDFDAVQHNGASNVGNYGATGSKGFEDPTLAYDPTVPTIEVCSDSQVSDKQAWMVNQPIIPMKGAAGLDMTGGEDWAGLTIDDVQSPDLLCQALYYDDGIAAWGDYYEVIAFFDETTRQVDDILLRSGYKGTIEAGNFVFEINEPIVKGSTPLSRGDGSNRDPKTDDNMRAIDRALIEAFRPQLDADQVDCVEAGSCYIIMSGTLPILVFMSVNLYVILEPQQQKIVQIEVGLKRPFRIGMGAAEVVGVTPTIRGTAAAGIPDCVVTYGTTWDDIEDDCLGGDSMAMAQVTSTVGQEMVLVQLGGTLLYFDRPELAVDEILPLEPDPDPDDTVSIISINAAYEGSFSMHYSDILRAFKSNVEAAIRAELGLAPEDLTGVEQLRTPDDPNLPAEVSARYPDRLRPGGIYAAFCTDDGPDGNNEYDSCFIDAAGRPVQPLTATLQSYVSAALGARVTEKFASSTFYVQEFERAMGEVLNGAPIDNDQINFAPNADRPDTIYATISLIDADTSYTVNLYYGGNDDRIHFINFQRGASRMEAVLLADAALPTPSDPSPSGVFTFNHLLGSPRLGLGASGTVTIDDYLVESRRALISVKTSSTKSVQVLAPYWPASSVAGYWLPLEGPINEFMPAATFSLYGNTLDATFYLLPDSDDPEALEVAAIGGTAFFGDVYFCGFPVRIGDYADELLAQIEDAGYPCETIVRRSENNVFITSIADLDSQIKLYVTNNMINEVFVWLR